MPKFLILTMNDCDGCNQVKRDLEGSDIEICDINKEECSKIAEELGVEFVPVAVKIGKNKKKEVCYLDKKEDGRIIAKCKDREYELWQK